MNHVVVLICLIVVSMFGGALSLPRVYAEENILLNGDFSEGLDYWNFVRHQVGNCPNISVQNDSRGNPYLALDTGIGSAVLAYQSVALYPTDRAILSFKVFGNRDSVLARVQVGANVGFNESYLVLEEFDPFGKTFFGGVPTYKWFDITFLSGYMFNLTFYAASNGTLSPTLCIDDVRISIAGGDNSVVTCNASPVWPVFANQTSVSITGEIFPASIQAANVTLAFTQPNGTLLNKQVETNSSGDYNLEYVPVVTGIWKVTAFWNGSATLKGASSCPIQFIVINQSSIEGLRCIINGVAVDFENPRVETLPSEKLFGLMEFETDGCGINENVPIIAFSTAEKYRWDLVAFQIGTVKDEYGFGLTPFGVKETVLPPALLLYQSPGLLDGRFSFNVSWSFPQELIVPNELAGGLGLVAFHPEFVAPPEVNSTFYIVIGQAGVLQAQDIAFPPSHKFLGQTVSSLWDIDPRLWEQFVPGRRNQSTGFDFLAIPIRVVSDPTPTIAEASALIDEAKLSIRHFPVCAKDLQNAEEYLNYARMNASRRCFSESLRLASRSLSIANSALFFMENNVNATILRVNQTFENFKNDWGNLMTTSELESFLDAAKSEFRTKGFAAALQSLAKFNETLWSYCLPSVHPALESLSKLRENLWNFPQERNNSRLAETLLNLASRNFTKGNYAVARSLADEASNVANNSLGHMKSLTGDMLAIAESRFSQIGKNGERWVNLSYLNRSISTARKEYMAENYAEALAVISEFNDKGDRLDSAFLLLTVLFAISLILPALYLFLVSTNKTGNTKDYTLRAIFAFGTGSIVSLAFQGIPWTLWLVVLIILPYLSVTIILFAMEMRQRNPTTRNSRDQIESGRNG